MVSTYTQPLSNYKNGWFCQNHLNMARLCGIIPCGVPAAGTSPTCNNSSHQSWYSCYSQHFTQLSYPGMQQVIRCQQTTALGANPFTLNIEQNLPDLDDIPGNEVTHTFHARSAYCIETTQWACGISIGWGKCYNSESSPQVLDILNWIWGSNDHLHPGYPGYIAYDNACNLLWHITTQHNPLR